MIHREPFLLSYPHTGILSSVDYCEYLELYISGLILCVFFCSQLSAQHHIGKAESQTLQTIGSSMLQVHITCLSNHSCGQCSGCRRPYGEGWEEDSIVYSPFSHCRVVEEGEAPKQLSLEIYIGFWILSKHSLLQQTRTPSPDLGEIRFLP